jgi:hypothetical protein
MFVRKGEKILEFFMFVSDVNERWATVKVLKPLNWLKALHNNPPRNFCFCFSDCISILRINFLFLPTLESCSNCRLLFPPSLTFWSLFYFHPRARGFVLPSDPIIFEALGEGDCRNVFSNEKGEFASTFLVKFSFAIQLDTPRVEQEDVE